MRPLRSLLLLIATALLASCQPTQMPPPAPALSFVRYQPIYLDVAKIEVIEEYQSPEHAPFIEHLIPISPSDAVHSWVNDRLHAVGNDRYLQVIIKEASVKATELPKPQGMEGFFTNSQDKRFDARLTVEMRIYGTRAMSDANLEVTATRSVTSNEKMSVAAREALFRRLVFDLMEATNAELEKNIYKYFGRYISYSQNP